MSKRFLFLLFSAIAIAGTWAFLRISPQSANVLWNLSKGGTWLLPLVIASAAIDSINPCAFSILLLTLGFLFSAGRLREDVARIGGMYVLGIFVAYFAIGLGLLRVLHLFSTPHFVGKIGAWLMLILGGLYILQVLFPGTRFVPRMPHVSHRTMATLIERGSLPGMFLLGGLVGLCEFPCTGGPYLAVLGLLRVKETLLSGLGYLLLYNLVFVLPLVIILLLASRKEVVEKVNTWQKENVKKTRLVTGGIMVALAIIILLFFV
ncbi:MAG: hypothetical protein HYW80_01790 [Parcubacteria group bacterium]|nr:hypothetical protein [Parcubacteria group bacterium]